MLLVSLGLTGIVRGQSQARPHLFYVMPMGGQAGASFDITVTGNNLDTPESLYFSVPGVKAETIGPGSNPKMTKPPPKKGGRQTSFRFKVTLPKDAKPGIHDIRVVTKGGISNPRAFVVGDLKEYVESEPNDDVPQANKVDLNSTVNGVISAPTDVDYFLFSGKKGQRVLASCLTTSIDSKLPALIEMYSKDGRYLGSGRGYHENDALLDCVLPADGDYLVRVCSFTYTQGGPDYFYRLTISTAPWIDAVFPTTIAAGKEAQVTFYGRNLPGGKLDPTAKVGGNVLETLTTAVKAPADAEARQRLSYRGWISPSASGLDGFEWRTRNNAGISNPILFTFASAPVVLDNGTNGTSEAAQKVPVPCEIAGRIEKKGNRDWYAFHAKKGDVTIIELIGDRLGAPLDLYFTLQDANGRVITEQDDANEILSPQFFTRTFDPPPYRFVAPADGDYQIMVSSRDAFVQAGPRHCYQLRISPPQPDFRLVTMPAPSVFPPINIDSLPDAPVIGQNGNQAIQVLVWRRDGFNSDILLTAKGLPEGVTVVPQVLPAGQKQTYLVLNAAENAPAWAGAVQIIGTATVKGKKLVREARAATITWRVPQINIPAISRLDRALVLAVRDKAPFSLVAAKERYSAFPGGRINVKLKLTRNHPGMGGNIQLASLSIPPGLTFNPTNLGPMKQDSGGGADYNVVLNVKPNAAPGLFTVVLRGQTQGGMVKGKGKGRPPIGTVFQVSTPITVTILPKQLAKLTVSPQTLKATPGKETTLLVKVARIYDFQGPFKIELILPASVKGIQAASTEIKAGENDAKLILRTPPGTPQGNHTVTIRATAQFQGHPVVHEARVNINVVKAKK
jgi:hypothetical protein